jgi:23S rRNA pseudouridine1911/1915/1917 synthase
LDRETSGVLLVAKSKDADRAFKRILEDRSIAEATRGASRATSLPVRKTYLALTWGVPPSGLIDLPLDRDFSSTLRVKMRVARPGSGLEARTEVEVLETANGYALCTCRLLTGRQHQIRVHLSAMGCPVVGDKLYGPDERLLARSADRQLDDDDLARLELPRQALHAHRYELHHPFTGAWLDLSTPLPPDLTTFWEAKQGERIQERAGERIDGSAARR